MSDEEEVPYDQSAQSTEDRWYTYKCLEKSQGREPMSWGEWLNAGQPLPEGAG